MNEKQELLAKLEALKAEKLALDAYIAEVPSREARLTELRDGWQRNGEITQTIRALRNCEFPIFEGGEWNRRRVIAMDNKWITLRSDNDEDAEVTRYRRDNGIQERCRSDYRKIDVEKALRVWTEWQKQQPA